MKVISCFKAPEVPTEFIQTFLKYWPKEVKLDMWFHDGPLPEGVPQSPRVTYKSLDDQPAWKQFKGLTAGVPDSKDFRFDLKRFTPKLYSIFCTKMSDDDWVIWLDSDIETFSKISMDTLRGWLKGDIVYLGRKDINYSETSFMAFNVARPTTQFFVSSLARIYHTGEVLNYKEFHDGFVFERLLHSHEDSELKLNSLSHDVEGLDAFHQSPLGDYMVHFKGPAKEGNPTVMVPEVYTLLTDFVSFYKPSELFLRCDDNRMVQIVVEASKHNSTIKLCRAEKSQRLEGLKRILARKGVKIVAENAKNLKDPFVYFDGSSDVRKIDSYKAVVLKDYIPKNPNNDGLRGPSAKFDEFYAEAKIYGTFALAAPVPFTLSKPLRVQPKNAVAAPELIENVKANTPKFTKWVSKLANTGREAVLISAGPTLEEQIPTIKALLSSGAPKTVYTVKHALPVLFTHGIDPDICVVLDARPLDKESTHKKTRRSLYDDVSPKTSFYIASMCAPETVDYLMTKAPVVGWHAANDGMMQAGLKEFEGKVMVGGGTCAAWRAWALAFLQGHKTFHLFGYDFFYPSKDAGQTSNEILSINVGPQLKPFFSTGELIAALQDFERIRKLALEQDLTLKIYGEGMVQACWEEPPTLPTWEDYTAA